MSDFQQQEGQQLTENCSQEKELTEQQEQTIISKFLSEDDEPHPLQSSCNPKPLLQIDPGDSADAIIIHQENEEDEESVVKFDENEQKVNEVISNSVLLANVITRLQKLDSRELKTKLTASQQSLISSLPASPKATTNNNFKEVLRTREVEYDTQCEKIGESQLSSLFAKSSKFVVFIVEEKKFYVPESLLEKVQDSVLWQLSQGDRTNQLQTQEGVVIPLIKPEQFSLVVSFLMHGCCELPLDDSQEVVELIGIGEALKLHGFCAYIRSHREGSLRIRQASDYMYYHPVVEGIIENFKELFFAPGLFPEKWAFELIEDDHKKPHWYAHVILSYFDGFGINPIWFTKQWEKHHKRQTLDYSSEAGSVYSKRSRASLMKSERLKRKPQSEYSVYYNERDWPQETTFGFLLTSEQLELAKIYNYHTNLSQLDGSVDLLSYQDMEAARERAYNHWLFNFFIRYIREVQLEEIYRNIRIPLPQDLDKNNINNALSRALRWRLKAELGAQLFIYHIPYQDPEEPTKTMPFFVQDVGEGKPIVHEFSVKLEFLVPTDELQKYKPISNINLRNSMQHLVKLEKEQMGHSGQSNISSQGTASLRPQQTQTTPRQNQAQNDQSPEVGDSRRVINFPVAGEIQANSFVEALRLRRERLQAGNITVNINMPSSGDNTNTQVQVETSEPSFSFYR